MMNTNIKSNDVSSLLSPNTELDFEKENLQNAINYLTTLKEEIREEANILKVAEWHLYKCFAFILAKRDTRIMKMIYARINSMMTKPNMGMTQLFSYQSMVYHTSPTTLTPNNEAEMVMLDIYYYFNHMYPTSFEHISQSIAEMVKNVNASNKKDIEKCNEILLKNPWFVLLLMAYLSFRLNYTYCIQANILNETPIFQPQGFKP